MKSGFTLIELSIVLVIIGLIVGGILAGQDLISAAAVHAQIAQIDKYNTAVRTFQGKYGYLPGDIPDPYASQFGFQSRGQYAGEGDGNGVLQGNCENDPTDWIDGTQQGCGELAVFWQDLSTAKLIDVSVPTGNGYPNINDSSYIASPGVQLGSSPSIYQWIPAAKLGRGNFVYIYSLNGINYFDVMFVANIGWSIESTGNSGAGANSMTVQQAYSIDKKMDDGLPQSGSVTACDMDWDVVNNQAIWAAGSGNQGAGGANCTPSTAAAAYHPYNCFDNNGIAGVQQYSFQNANMPNCALSFRFQ